MDLYAVVELIFNDTSNSIFEFAEEEVTASYDISRSKDGSVIAYLIDNVLCIEFNGKLVLNENSENFFSHFDNLYKIVGMENIDTSLVTNMKGMFSGTKLQSVDLSHFDTSNVTNMQSMFVNSAFTNLDLSSFNTSKVTNMSSMFANMTNIESLDLSGFDTFNVTDMSRMFYHCEALMSLDITKFNTSKVTNMSEMFNSCSKLEILDLSSFDTSKVVDMNKMFYFNNNLKELDISNFNTQRVINMSYMFSYCTSLKELDLSHFDTSSVTDMSDMFHSASSLQKLNLSGFDTSKVTDMTYMFRNSGFDTVDLSSFDTSNVTNMYGMFAGAKITTLNLKHFDTSSVTNMDSMFQGCINLKEIDLSGFNTSKVTRISAMFYECKSLEKIDLSTFDTTNMENISHLFYGCSSLKEINFGNFDTSKVTYMGYMFHSCKSLEKLDLSSFDTSNVTDMKYMFYNCTKLKEINLSSFDTSKVTNMNHLFRSCYELKILDLSSFDTGNVKDMSFMLGEMNNLEKVYVSSKWSTAKVTDYDNLFHNNYKLVGQNGTTYKSGVDYKEYARLDLIDSPGLFSRKLTLESEKYDLSKDYIYLGKDELDLNAITKTNEESIVEEDNKLNVYYNEELTKGYDLIKILSSDYDLSKDYIYLRSKDFNSTDITFVNGYNIIDNHQLKIYSSYNGDLLASYYLINLYSDKYDLNKKVLNVGNDDYLSHIEVVNAEIKQEGNRLNIYFGEQLVDSYTLLTISSDTYDLSKEYIYTGMNDIDTSKITCTNEELLIENDKLNIYYQGELLKSYDLIKYSSTIYNTLDENYIYVGLDNPTTARVDLSNGTQEVENNMLNIYYNNTLLHSIEIVSIYSDYYDLTKGYIYVGAEEFDINKITVINADKKYNKASHNFVVNKGYMPYGEAPIVFFADVVGFSSSYYTNLSNDNDYIYLETSNFFEQYINYKNMNAVLENNQLKMYYLDTLLKTYDLVQITGDAQKSIVENQDTATKYIYIKPNNFDEPIAVQNGSFEIINNVLNIYYKEQIISSYIIASISSNEYSLLNFNIFLIDELFDMSKINAVNCELVEENNFLNVKMNVNSEYSVVVDTYAYTTVSSDKYDLTKNYIYLGTEELDLYQITSENARMIIEDNWLNIYSITNGLLLKSYALVKVNFNQYSFNNKILYIGNNHDYLNKIEIINATVEQDGNKIHIYYDNNLIDTYTLLGITSDDYDLTKDYIYTGVNHFDISKINSGNEKLAVEDNKLKVYYQDELVKSYDLVSISSHKYQTLKDKYIFVGRGTSDGVSIDVINGTQKLENNNIYIYYNDILIDTIKIVSYNSDYYDLTKEYIDVGTGDIETWKIRTINGGVHYSSESNSVIITYSPRPGMGIVLAEYPVVKYFSDYYDFNKDYIYIGTSSPENVNLYPELSNVTYKHENNKFNLYYQDELIESFDLISISTNTYSIETNGYFYMRPSKNQTTIEITNGSYEIIDDIMNIYYKDSLVKTLKIIGLSSDYYDLTTQDIVLINETLDLTKINTFNCDLRIDEVTLSVSVVVYDDSDHSTWSSFDTYNYFEISSDYYDLSKDYIYTGPYNIGLSRINASGGSLNVTGANELELRNSVGRVVKTYKIVQLWGHGYDLFKDYIFLRDQQFKVDQIEVAWGNALLEDDKLNIYYENNLLDSFDLVQISTQDYVLGTDSIYIGAEELDLNKITLTNGHLEADEDAVKMYYKDEYLGCYFITKIYSDIYDLTKDYIFTGTEPMDFTKIHFTNGSMSTHPNMIQIYNRENNLVAQFDIITLTSSYYDLSKEYIYLGIDNFKFDYIDAGMGIFSAEDDKLNLYYKDEILKSYDLIKVSSSKYNFYSKYIYLGLNEIDINDINLSNGTIKIENNKLNFYYSEDLLASYDLIYISSTDYDLTKPYIFVGINEFDISNINVTNARLEYEDEKVFVVYEDWLLEEFSVIKVSSNVYDVQNDKIHIGDHRANREQVIATNAIVSDPEDGYFKILFNNKVIHQYLIEANIISITSPCARYEFTLNEPETITIPIEFNPGEFIYNKTLTWTSSDESVAIVDSNGTVTPVGAGRAIITATTHNGKTSDSEIIVVGNISYSSTGYVGIYTGDEKTIKVDVETLNAQVLYSLDGDYYYSNLPTFVNPGRYKVYYMISAGDYYNIAYGDEEVAIYGIDELDKQLVIKNDILVVNCFNQTFMDIKLKMKIFSEVTYNFLHYDKDLTIDEGETIRTGDYLKIKFDMEGDSYFQYRLAVLGDLNGDAEIDSLDLATMLNHISGKKELTNEYLETAYLNNDEEIDSLDLAYLMNHIAGKEGY